MTSYEASRYPAVPRLTWELNMQGLLRDKERRHDGAPALGSDRSRALPALQRGAVKEGRIYNLGDFLDTVIPDSLYFSDQSKHLSSPIDGRKPNDLFHRTQDSLTIHLLFQHLLLHCALSHSTTIRQHKPFVRST